MSSAMRRPSLRRRTCFQAFAFEDVVIRSRIVSEPGPRVKLRSAIKALERNNDTTAGADALVEGMPVRDTGDARQHVLSQGARAAILLVGNLVVLSDPLFFTGGRP
jgi:hypothetical protein